MRAKSLTAVMGMLLATASLVAVTASPASADLFQGTFPAVQCTTNPNVGTQAQDIPYGINVPTSVPAGSSFAVTFPGGVATLPSIVLGFVPVADYVNLASTYQLSGGTFDQNTYSESGSTLINGTPTADSHSFPAPDTITLTTDGPIPPGDLTTPDRTINMIAGTEGSTINITENTLTSTVVLGTPPTTSNVTATCPVPPTIIASISVVASGPTTTVNAGADVSGDVNTPIAVHGSYIDPFGTPALSWTIDDPNCTFADPTAADTTVTCTTVGTFAATLTADDGVGHPLVHDTAQVASTSPNQPPTVNAGSNVSGQINDDINLNGSITDPDSPNVSAQWTVDSPNCGFGDDTDPTTTINCTVAGTYAATLTADDGINPPVSDSATVTVTNPPPGLNVSAGPSVSGNTNTAITLTGKITDPGFTPTAQWTSDGPTCSFANAAAAATTITCTAAGIYAATLTGHDGTHADVSSTALVSVSQPNVPPTVDAGPDITTGVNIAAALHGTVTDPDSSPTITWSSDTPACTFGNVHQADTTVTCSSTGVAAVTLTAHDTSGVNVTDTALVTVSGNAPPTANAGPDVMTGVNVPAALHGVVADPDNTPTAHWSTNNPNCTFGDANAADTTITCSVGGVFAATLTASDGVNAPVSDTAIVTVNAPNTPPTVYAGPDQTDIARHPVSLPGMVTDPDNTPTVHWANGSGHCVFGNPNVAATTITCDTAGIYAATLTADDGVNPPVSDTAIITLTAPSCVGVCLAIGDSTAWEGSVASLPITLSTAELTNVTVTATIVTSPGGAINGFGLPTSAVQDFKSNPIHNITIKAGQRQAYVAVKAIADTVSGEGPETFQVVLSNPAGVAGIGLGRSVGTGTILDATGIPAGQILVGSTAIVEGDTTPGCINCKYTAKVPVLLTGPKAAVSVKYSTQNAGAVAPTDYIAKTNLTLAFTLTGATQKTLTVITIGNNTPSGTKGINIVFSNPVGVPLPSPGHIDILDND